MKYGIKKTSGKIINIRPIGHMGMDSKGIPYWAAVICKEDTVRYQFNCSFEKSFQLNTVLNEDDWPLLNTVFTESKLQEIKSNFYNLTKYSALNFEDIKIFIGKNKRKYFNIDVKVQSEKKFQNRNLPIQTFALDMHLYEGTEGAGYPKMTNPYESIELYTREDKVQVGFLQALIKATEEVLNMPDRWKKDKKFKEIELEPLGVDPTERFSLTASSLSFFNSSTSVKIGSSQELTAPSSSTSIPQANLSPQPPVNPE